MPHTKKRFLVVNVPDGQALEFARSPMSGKPCFGFVPPKRATRFTRHAAQAACCLLAFLDGHAYNLSIEEADGEQSP